MKTYRPSWGLVIAGILFIAASGVMFNQALINQDADSQNGNFLAFLVGSLVLLLVGLGLIGYWVNFKVIVEPEGLVFKNIFGGVSNRVPFDQIHRVTSSTDEWTDSDGNRHRSTGYFIQVSGIGLIRISSYANVSGLIQEIEAHTPGLADDPLSKHSYAPVSRSVLDDDIGG